VKLSGEKTGKVKSQEIEEDLKKKIRKDLQINELDRNMIYMT
jgi:hypothetical protein